MATGNGPILNGDMTRAAMVCRVRDQLIAGATRGDITEYAADQGWSIGLTDLSGLVNEARSEIASYVKEDRNTEFALAAERLSGLYRSCMYDNKGKPLPRAKQDRRAAFNVLREINELYGLHAPKKFDVAASPFRAHSTDELKRELERALSLVNHSLTEGSGAFALPAAEVAGG